ncbi:hypothetical protein ACR9WD_05895 [Glutamicibacter sp. PAEs-4]|uniref:hypothetical protein n=1 Tax=Glutamicibacter sp. PAEs-4 TaxID=3444114 RepID=UPI003EC146D5
MTDQAPLNPDALEAAENALAPHHEDWEGLQIYYTEAAKIAVSAYLAVAQPEVTSDAGLRVGSLIKDRTGRRLWRVWCTGAPGIIWRDDEGMPATPVFPARVLYRPEVDE